MPKKSPPKSPRKSHPKSKTVLLWDATYTVLRYDESPEKQAGPMEPKTIGMLDEGKRIIHIRACANPNEEIATVIHELIHHALGAEHDRLSERAMSILDQHLAHNLQALGIDLSPLLRGYE